MLDAKIFALGGFSLGLISTLALRDWGDFTRGELVAGAGSMIGIIGAVFAGRMIEKYRINLQQQRELSRVKEAVGFVELISTFNAITDPQMPIPEPQQSLAHRYMYFEHASSALDYAIRHAQIDNMELFTALYVLQGALTSRLEIMSEFRQQLLITYMAEDRLKHAVHQFDLYAATISDQVGAVRNALRKVTG